jgi:branched-chain amino acid transport system permease protein
MDKFIGLLANGLAVGGVYACVALGFTLIYKATRVFNFAVGNFVCIGAFLIWTCVVQLHLPIAVGIFLGLLGGGVLGFLCDRLFVRPMIGQDILAIIIMTLVLSFFLNGLAMLIWGSFPAAYPDYLPRGSLGVGGAAVGTDIIFCFVAALVIAGLIAFYFERAKGSLAMRATAEDHQVAQAAGIRVKNISTLVWSVTGALCAISGLLLGTIRGVDMYLPEFGLKVVPAVLIGGLESIPGAVAGGLIIGVLEKLASGYINPIVGGGIETCFAYIVMIIFIIFKPHGLFGLKEIERL